MSDPGAEPIITVVRGEPTDEEIAALITVLTAARPAGGAPPARPASQWAAYWRQMSAPLMPGPDAWRSSVR